MRRRALSNLPETAAVHGMAAARLPWGQHWFWPLLWLLLALSVPAQGRAWTETMVIDAGAEVKLDGDGRMTVRLRTELRIMGGYLSRFELAGLPTELTLTADQPPVWQAVEGGELSHPAVSVLGNGRIRVEFGGSRQAPKRGRYRLTLAFAAHGVMEEAARAAGFVRWRVPLPAWETNLEDVVVDVDAPPGSRPGPSDWLLQATTDDEPGHTRIVFRRSQLPRTVPMDLLVDVPASGLHVAGQELQVLRLLATERSQTARYWLLAVQMLALFKLGSAVHRARRQRYDLRFLFPGLPPWLRVAMVLGASAVGLWSMPSLESYLVLAALSVLLVLERRAMLQRLSVSARAHGASRAELSALRWRILGEHFNASAVLDLSTPAGVVVLGCIALLTLAILRSGGDSHVLPFALIAGFLFLSGCRRFQPWSVAEKARNLLSAQRELAEISSQIMLFSEGPGSAIQDVRLHLDPSTPAQGLVELSLVVGEVDVLGQRQQVLCWLVIVDADSRAHQSIMDALPQSRGRLHPSEARVSFLAPMQQLEREAQALRRWLTAEQVSMASAA